MNYLHETTTINIGKHNSIKVVGKAYLFKRKFLLTSAFN